MFKQYFSTNFLFEINRVMLERADKVLLAIGLALIVLAAIFKLAAVYSPTPIDKKYRQKFFRLFFSVGLAEVVWFGARYQNVRFFGTHFAALLVLLIGLVWLGFIIKNIIKHYRQEKTDWEKEQVKLKYLPK